MSQNPVVHGDASQLLRLPQDRKEVYIWPSIPFVVKDNTPNLRAEKQWENHILF